MLKFRLSSDDKEQKENLDYFNLCFSSKRTCVSSLSVTVIHTMSKGGFRRQVRATVEGNPGGSSRQEPGGRNWSRDHGGALLTGLQPMGKAI